MFLAACVAAAAFSDALILPNKAKSIDGLAQRVLVSALRSSTFYGRNDRALDFFLYHLVDVGAKEAQVQVDVPIQFESLRFGILLAQRFDELEDAVDPVLAKG